MSHSEQERCVPTPPLSSRENGNKGVAQGHRIGKNDKGGAAPRPPDSQVWGFSLPQRCPLYTICDISETGLDRTQAW